MSRMTAAQVISLGEYLNPDFEPASLTVSQLLGILGYHNIPYPTPYTKAKLVNVFNNEVKTRAAKFKKERQKKENSQASDDGITDGITGKPLSKKGKAPAPAPTPASSTRRSSRRMSQAPMTEESSPTRPEPAKRRRSSAQPTLGGGSSRTAIPVPTTLAEESEPDDDDEVMPARKVGRTKKLASPGASSRGILATPGAEDSGWEDNNIFQSGAESSSPARPSPVRKKVPRVSSTKRQARKSTSAPPQMADLSPPKAPIPAHSPPQSSFRPSLPQSPYVFSPPPKLSFTPVHETRQVEPLKLESPAPPQEEEDQIEESQEIAETNYYEEVVPKKIEGGDIKDDKEHKIDLALSRIQSEIESVDDRAEVDEQGSGGLLETLARIVCWFGIVAVTYAFFSYKVESSAIGFCDRGSNTSLALETVLAKRAEYDACSKARSAALLAALNNTTGTDETGMETCPLPPLIPRPHPDSCTPCPDHATCAHYRVSCDSGYLLKPHILLSFVPVAPSDSSLATVHAPQLGKTFLQAFSSLTSGLPGFGSVGLPPRCVEDPQRKRNIGALGKSIERWLGTERGQRVCHGQRANAAEPETSTEAAISWGVEVDKLREHFRQIAAPHILPTFDELFNEAIQQLSQWGGVFVSETPEGVRYVAHKTPYMTWDCVVIVKARELWAAWRSTVLVSILAVLAAIGTRLRLTQKQKEKRRVAGLVQVALDTLRNQEMAHYTDPLTAPQPYLSSIQLRDVVLQDEHSVGTRRRLWERVERVVEGNANVRANLEEIEGGDETRVWRWVGSAGTGRTPARKEIYHDQEEE